MKNTFILLFLSLPLLASVSRSYTLLDLHSVVSNHARCEEVLKDLEELSQKPIELKFHQKSIRDVRAKHQHGKIKNYQHRVLKQKTDKNKVHRVALGTFELGKNKIEYISNIVGDVSNSSHNYLYPAIFSAFGGQCQYMAMIQPDENSIKAFQKNIRSGAVLRQKDLF